MRTWGTACRVFRTLCNRTRHQWRDSSRNRRWDSKKDRTPNCLGTNCSWSLAFYHVSKCFHGVLPLILLPVKTRPELEEMWTTELGAWNTFWILVPQWLFVSVREMKVGFIVKGGEGEVWLHMACERGRGQWYVKYILWNELGKVGRNRK